MAKITVRGYLGRDASMNESKTGVKFVAFPMSDADAPVVNGERKSVWYDVLWFTFNPKMVEHLKKGHYVEVDGKLDSDIEAGQDGTYRCRRKVRAFNVDFVSLPQQKQDNSNAEQKSTEPEEKISMKESVKKTETVKAPAAATTDDSDLPF